MSNVRTCANYPRLAAVKAHHNELAHRVNAAGLPSELAAARSQLRGFQHEMVHNAGVLAVAGELSCRPLAAGDRVALHPWLNRGATTFGRVVAAPAVNDSRTVVFTDSGFSVCADAASFRRVAS